MEKEFITKIDSETSSAPLNLVYKLGGDFPEGIDIASLCPMLAGIADLIKTSNNTIRATDTDITVRVKPFKEGSFLIDLALQAQQDAATIFSALNADELTKLKTLLECIGLIGGGATGTAIGLVKLIKWLKGKPKEVRKISPDAVEYTNESNNKLVVNGNVHALYQNCTVIATLEKVVAMPLKIPNVTSLTTYLANQEVETKVELAKEEGHLFEGLPSRSTSDSDSNLNEDNHQVVWVHPKTGNYEGEPTSWSFRKIGEKTTFRAKLADQSFLGKLKSGEVRLSGKDDLKVQLIELQTVENGKEKISRCINKVVEYRPAPTQSSFEIGG